jgi:molybdopterin/thiamine biosynthesis adenylyltransferase
MTKQLPLTDEERATYEWQIDVADFGEAGQEKLKAATVMVSRCGGLGSVVCYELAAAGIGNLILAHAGDVKHSDLNRQLLMTHDWLGKPRIETVKNRLLDLNPRLNIRAVGENVSDENAADLVKDADVVIDAAPLFEERYAMNREAWIRGIPIVECAMFDLDAQITTMVPGETPCLRCLHPETPPVWKRKFPVFGAVSGTIGCLAAMEAVKLIAGFGECLLSRMMLFDMRSMKVRTHKLQKRAGCKVCDAS